MIDTTGTVRYYNRSSEDYLVVLGFMGDCWASKKTVRLGRWVALWSSLRGSFFTRTGR